MQLIAGSWVFANNQHGCQNLFLLLADFLNTVYECWSHKLFPGLYDGKHFISFLADNHQLGDDKLNQMPEKAGSFFSLNSTGILSLSFKDLLILAIGIYSYFVPKSYQHISEELKIQHL